MHVPVRCNRNHLTLTIYLPAVLMILRRMALVVLLPLYTVSRSDSLSMAAILFSLCSVGSWPVNVPALEPGI